MSSKSEYFHLKGGNRQSDISIYKYWDPGAKIGPGV